MPPRPTRPCARAVRRAASEALFTTESGIADRTSRIEALIAEKEALVQTLPGAKAAGPDVAALSARIQGLRADPSAASAPPVAGPAPAGRLTPPVTGAPAQRFGQPSPSGGQIEGWTWTPPPGAQVSSPAAGRVEYAGPLRGWDNVVIVDIGGGYHLVLAGLRTVTASAGAAVSAGQPVGRMAADTAPSLPRSQLYLEVRKGGDPVDPARFFAAIGQ